MNLTLQQLLRELLQSGESSNPALNFLLKDYAKYHFVMVILGGVAVSALVTFSIIQLRLFFRNGRPFQYLKTVAGMAYLYLGTLTGLTGAALALIVLGNFGNALKPRTGFENSLAMIEDQSGDSPSGNLQDSFISWINSGRQAMPKYIDHMIHERLSWQRPKAIICLILLVLIIFLSRKVWASLIQQSKSFGRLKLASYFSAGILLSLIGILLLVMFIGNTQGSIAPVALTLLFS